MNEELLGKVILKNGYSQFRFKQAKKNVFTRLIESWDAATDLPEDLRALLAREVPIESLSARLLVESAKKDTLKALFATRDGLFIEAVLMRHDRDRRTVCVSSQAGCPMRCSFCATGKLGFKRNLTAEEIVDQVLFFARLINKKKECVTNVVYMGMG
ncbi:TPA: 23S rRNA (adenine(2503)-C(2))-methyltransferase RlmN, partial [Candidatus Azambacteria bacterium]|nr:23S rRNA (adenine(2503)-C(2))-methyltransferase RlmN [Candidatus Azambacteria bacterium]